MEQIPNSQQQDDLLLPPLISIKSARNEQLVESTNGIEITGCKSCRGDELLIPVTEAARLLSLSTSSLYELLATKKLVGSKVGRRTLIRRSDLEAFVAKLPPVDFSR